MLGIALTLALITSLLVVATPAAALTQPQVSIPFGGNVIGASTTYTVTFTAGAAVPVGGHIVVTFPAGTNLGSVTGINVTALSGIGGGDDTEHTTNWTVTGLVTAPQVLTISLNATAVQDIGQGSLVGVEVIGVLNPATPGTYTLTVGTTDASTPAKTKEAAIESTSYSIIPPTPTPLPGVVSAYNSAGILMQQSNSIQTCINAAGVGGRVEVGPGTYDEALSITTDRLTVVAAGDPGTVIIKDANSNGAGGNVTINVAGSLTLGGVTFEGFTFETPLFGGVATPLSLGASASYVTVKDCVIDAGTTDAIELYAGSTSNTITGVTIDATHATTGLLGINAMGQATIMDTTITVGSAATSMAIMSSGGTTTVPGVTTTNIKNVTITGSSGLGIQVTGGAAVIDGAMISMVTNALDINDGNVTVKNSTIDECGGPVTAPASPVTVDNVTAPTVVQMYNNNIQNSTDYAYAVAVGSGNVSVTAHNNNLVSNKKQLSVGTINAGNTVTFTHNWWGASTGPALGSTSATPATTTPYLTNSADGAGLAMNTDKVVAQTTVGVDVNCVDASGSAAAVGTIAVSKYAANPEANAPRIKGTGSVLGYYDVYVAGAPANTSVQLKFYGAVNGYCKLMYAGGLGGEWLDVTGTTGVNTAGGYVYFIVTGGSSPSITDLGGTPFALVEDKSTPAGPAITAAAGGSPVVGAYDVSTAPMFTWGPVLGSIRYEIALSEDPTFTIIEWSYNVDQTFYKVDEALRYDTTYYWRVRGVLGEPYQEMGQWVTPATPWTTGIFTTAMEPAEAAEPIVVEPTKPEVNVEIPPTKITVEPSTPAIPTYMLWVIVAVGAVLVIALIVLIVRTRRVV